MCPDIRRCPRRAGTVASVRPCLVEHLRHHEELLDNLLSTPWRGLCVRATRSYYFCPRGPRRKPGASSYTWKHLFLSLSFFRALARRTQHGGQGESLVPPITRGSVLHVYVCIPAKVQLNDAETQNKTSYVLRATVSGRTPRSGHLHEHDGRGLHSFTLQLNLSRL